MERLTLLRLARELQEQWAGAFVQQAWQDLRGRVVLRLRRPGPEAANAFLLLSPLTSAQGLGLLAERPAVPPRPPALAAYLRAHLVGGRFASASCPAGDRVVELAFETREGSLRIVLEAIGTRGNLVALDGEARVRAAWLWQPPETHPLRPLEPGGPYAAPPMPRRGAHSAAEEDSGLGNLRDAGDWLESAATLVEEAVSDAAAEVHARRERERLLSRADKIRTDLARLADPSEVRRLADALAASLGAVARGGAEARVPDPCAPDRTVAVPLDPRLSPGANLNRLYDKARRVERGRRALEARLAATLAEVEAVRADGAAEARGRDREPAVEGPYRRLRAANGWPLWVGRNGRENDRLVREARPWDLWFHARDVPGAHVVLRLPAREARVPEAIVLEAAAVAAAHSRAAGEAGVDVLVVEAGRVRKPRGASPGRVVVAGERVVRVRGTRAPP